jgi:Ca2+-binding RTX toxin-like protein
MSISRGNGHDTIIEDRFEGSNDQLIFEDIASGEVTLVREGMDLRVLIPESAEGAGDAGSVLLKHHFEARWGYGVETLHFADDVSWTQADLRALMIEQDRENGETEIVGFRSADVIRSTEGDNILRGMQGNDTYIYARGNGHDTIIEDRFEGSNDQLIFEDIASGEVTLVREGMDLRVLIPESAEGAGDEGSVFVMHQFESRWGFGVETLHFADGVSWTQGDLREMMIEQDRQNGETEIVGFRSADVIRSTEGDNILRGMQGNDTYIYARGNGHDTIIEGSHQGNNDQLIFEDIASSEVTLVREGMHLRILIPESAEGAGDEGSVFLMHHFEGRWGFGVETVHFADGVSWTQSQVATLLDHPDAGPLTHRGFGNDDVFVSSGANEVFLGGGGDDTFVFAPGFGHDTIVDFSAGAGSDDTIVFDEAVFADLDAVIAAAEQQGDDVLITANDDDALLLKGVSLSQLHEDDFRFVA